MIISENVEKALEESKFICFLAEKVQAVMTSPDSFAAVAKALQWHWR